MIPETDIVIFIDLEKIHMKNWEDHIVDKVNTRYPFKER